MALVDVLVFHSFLLLCTLMFFGKFRSTAIIESHLFSIETQNNRWIHGNHWHWHHSQVIGMLPFTAIEHYQWYICNLRRFLERASAQTHAKLCRYVIGIRRKPSSNTKVRWEVSKNLNFVDLTKVRRSERKFSILSETLNFLLCCWISARRRCFWNSLWHVFSVFFMF